MGEKTVLGGYMSSRENYEISAGDELFCLSFVLPVKQSVVGENKSACFKAALYGVPMTFCEGVVISCRTYEETANG